MFYPARRPKTHMAIVAEVDSRQWLCDLGFGSYGIRAPMALDTLDVDITQDFDTFRLSRSAEGEYLLEAKVEGEWARQYGFDLTLRNGLISFRPTTLTPRTRMPSLCRSGWWCSTARRDARFCWAIC
jgi:arylamine N-acetyltransferase